MPHSREIILLLGLTIPTSRFFLTLVAICELILQKIGMAIGIYLTCSWEALIFSKTRDYLASISRYI
jgi:hypothetical protein